MKHIAKTAADQPTNTRRARRGEALMEKDARGVIPTRVFGIDPGTRNFAIIVLDKGLCVHADMFPHAIKSLAAADKDQIAHFRLHIGRLLRDLQPNAIIIERFLVRNFGTKLIEIVGIMIGIIASLVEKSCDMQLVMPSTWKQAFSRAGHNLGQYYAEAKDVLVPPHIVDAMLMATYMYGEGTFNKFQPRQHRYNIQKAITFLEPEALLKPKRVKKP